MSDIPQQDNTGQLPLEEKRRSRNNRNNTAPNMSISNTTAEEMAPAIASPLGSWVPRLLRIRRLGDDDGIASERTSLLPKATTDSSNSSVSRQNGQSSPITDLEEPAWMALVFHEFILLTKMSMPVILAYTLQNSLQTISVLVVGRLSPEHLAAAAFSYMFAMCTAWLIALGGTTALDTLCSSSFTGSKNPHELGTLLQRSFVVLGAMYIPVCVLWWFSEGLFLKLGQEPGISKDSALFLRCLIPGGLGYIFFEATKKFLQAQGIMRAGTYVLLLTSPLSALFNYLLVYTFSMGLVGAPLATGLTYWISFGCLVGYARFVRGWERWGGWDRNCLNNLGTFARLAGLGVVMVGTEWVCPTLPPSIRIGGQTRTNIFRSQWAFEIVALAAGRLGTVPLASQSVIMTTDQVLNTIPFGIGVAASTRVGNLLGARDAHGAARAANTAAWLSIAVGTLVLAGMMSAKDSFALIFNDDMEVVRLTAKVMPFVALFQIADGLNGFVPPPPAPPLLSSPSSSKMHGY